MSHCSESTGAMYTYTAGQKFYRDKALGPGASGNLPTKFCGKISSLRKSEKIWRVFPAEFSEKWIEHRSKYRFNILTDFDYKLLPWAMTNKEAFKPFPETWTVTKCVTANVWIISQWQCYWDQILLCPSSWKCFHLPNPTSCYAISAFVCQCNE